MGGANGAGTAFRVAANGTLTTLVSFSGINGANPRAGLAQGLDGSFFGTTPMGGAASFGTVSQMGVNGTLTTLVSFNYVSGAWPHAGLVQGTDGNFYGTTEMGGANGTGTTFRMAANGTLTTLVSFSGINGAYPQAGLARGNDGSIYGTTYNGGTNGSVTVFRMTTGGTLTSLHSFTGLGDGANPYADLVQGNDGNIYGTAYYGGANSRGTVFQITASGTFTFLAAFSGTNGANPSGALVQGSDGNFYGTTENGGAYTNQVGTGYGTVFEMTPDGTLTTLVSFNGTNGAAPQAGLVQGTDGSFYGTTSGGGRFNNGTVFRLSFLAPPVITLLVTNVLLSADNNCQGLMPDLTGTNYTLISDPCSNSVVLRQSVAASTVLALGTNQVVLTLTDGCGNAAYATNFVIVQDTTTPVLAGLPPLAASYPVRSGRAAGARGDGDGQL